MFVYLKDWHNEDRWWEWCQETMCLINFNGGGFDINENADYWLTAEMHPELKTWHDVYVKYCYNPLAADVHCYDVWISPDGEFFEGDAHAVMAEKIVKLIYGIEIEDPLFHGRAEDHLISHGWVKATRGYMWSIYQQRDATWKLTQATYNALFDYCTLHGLKMPGRIEIISDAIAECGGIYGPDNINW